MAIREDLVASAAKCEFPRPRPPPRGCDWAEIPRADLADSARPVLLDPSVASSPVDKKVAFLQAKNLTQEEISAALGRVGADGAQVQQYTPPTASAPAQQPPQYYGQYPPPYPPYGWQQPPPQPLPKRDWRDWFIMATVVSGVSYGLFSLGKVITLDFSTFCSPEN